MKKIENQKQIYADLSSLWITASAGSGKTSKLVERIIELLISGVSPSQILCLTFTKAASIEMHDRISQRLFQWANLDDHQLKINLRKYNVSKKLDLNRVRSLSLRLLEDYPSINIQTIHSFCENILKKFPIEAGVLPNFSVLAANEIDNYILEARNLAFKKYRGNPEFDNSLKYLVIKNDEKRFNELFSELISKRISLSKIWSDSKELEKVIEYIYQLFDLERLETPSSLISKACQLSKSRLQSLSNLVNKLLEGTSKDNLNSRIIDNWLNSKERQRERGWENYRSVFLTKKNSISKNILSKKILNKYPNLLADINAEAEKIFKVQEKISFINISCKIISSLTVFKYIMIEYQKIKLNLNLLDYDDLIFFTLNLFKKTDISPWVLFKFDQQIKHFLIDEAQDTSLEQWNLLYTLITEIFSTNSFNKNDKTIFVVGDEKQSIFSFQGANPENLENFKNKFVNFLKEINIDLEIGSLSTSYRSLGIILKFVDHIFGYGSNAQIIPKMDKWSNHNTFRLEDSGLIEMWPLIEKHSNRRNAWDLPVNQLEIISSESELARLISIQIKNWLVDGEILVSANRFINAGDIMILVRKRGILFEKIISELKRNSIPVVSSEKIKLKDYLVIKDLIKLMQFVLLPNDDFILANVLKGPLFNITEDELFTLSIDRGQESLWDSLLNYSKQDKKYNEIYNSLRSLLEKKSFYSPFKFFSEILDSGGRKKFLTYLGKENNEIIDEFLNQILEYEENNIISFQGFIHWFENSSTSYQIDLGSIKNKVRVLTVHSSKGLESPIVFLPDTTSVPVNKKNPYIVKENNFTFIMFPSALPDNKESRYFRINLSNKEKEYQEYLRLFYVAMTRARDRIYICGCKQTRNIDKGSWYDLAEGNFEKMSGWQYRERLLGDKTLKVKFIK
ncbi:MAG: ATP-dependent DNA helicase PcrA [Alphaproteobacteria bacterium MarineAlpha2_Bin1]|nr:MAG: ATP-dependent DNA helicase PcrA [Alphaproteobacteria bacterium MarineAlpha2_Bin1]